MKCRHPVALGTVDIGALLEERANGGRVSLLRGSGDSRIVHTRDRRVRRREASARKRDRRQLRGIV